MYDSQKSSVLSSKRQYKSKQHQRNKEKKDGAKTTNKTDHLQLYWKDGMTNKATVKLFVKKYTYTYTLKMEARNKQGLNSALKMKERKVCTTVSV